MLDFSLKESLVVQTARILTTLSQLLTKQHSAIAERVIPFDWKPFTTVIWQSSMSKQWGKGRCTTFVFWRKKVWLLELFRGIPTSELLFAGRWYLSNDNMPDNTIPRQWSFVPCANLLHFWLRELWPFKVAFSWLKLLSNYKNVKNIVHAIVSACELQNIALVAGKDMSEVFDDDLDGSI